MDFNFLQETYGFTTQCTLRTLRTLRSKTVESYGLCSAEGAIEDVVLCRDPVTRGTEGPRSLTISIEPSVL